MPSSRPDATAWGTALGAVLLLGGIVAVVVALVTGRTSHRGRAVGSAGPPVTDAAGRHLLPGFGETAVEVTDATGKTVAMCLLLAATQALREQGLMRVTDRTLGGFDGMLFDFGRSDDIGEFWMRNTPQPLSVAFFDDRGRFVSSADMDPCGDSGSCPTYGASGPYVTAIEVPRGHLAAFGIAPGAALRRTAGPCPATTS